jgi:hypothetical protein
MSHKFFRLGFVLILVIGLAMITASQPARAAGPWYVATTGADNNDCLSPGTPCATINGALAKASSGDTVDVAEGTYMGSANEVVLIDRDITLSGGWDANFATQSGLSILDGQDARRALQVNNMEMLPAMAAELIMRATSRWSIVISTIILPGMGMEVQSITLTRVCSP